MSAARLDGAELGALGVTLHEGGADVAVYSSVADRVELCVFDEHGAESRLDLKADASCVWRAAVDGLAAGHSYGFRVHGPYDPTRGLWCDPAKLLVDPYARAIDGTLRRVDELGRRGADSAPYVPRSVVVDAGGFDWGTDELPAHEWEDTVVYELHVRGATVRHPGIPAELRGTYLGVAHESFLEHLVGLGVTTVELLPVYEWLDEPFLVADGLVDYWGYNPIGFFAPTARYRAELDGPDPAGQVRDAKAMVKALHAAGIEVVLDVVYNHTAEGGSEGDTLSLKGLDAPAYYRIDEDGSFVDTTGCGTSLNAASPVAVRLVLDSMRAWATEFHVDGFRFDLAPTLARIDGRFEPTAPILSACASDPVLSVRKLICEPWDVGEDDSFVLGRFGPPFREWNAEYRNTVRDFWRGTPGTLPALATRLAGSADLFAPERGASASINFVTCHDGFTLRDLVSYASKHNGANVQRNRDGSDDNRSWNWGAEGDTDNPSIEALRVAHVRALLTTLFMSRGVPMLLGGDELWRTQRGNNNAYCQDNEVSWYDWETTDQGLRAFVSRLVALRRSHARLLDAADPEWHAPSGAAMSPVEWHEASAVAMWLGPREGDGELLGVLVNGTPHELAFRVADGTDAGLVVELSSARPAEPRGPLRPDGVVAVPSRSVTVLGRGRQRR